MIAAPLLRRYGMASLALAAGALAVIAVAIVGLVFVDSRIGQAAIESNRKQYMFCLACELPVFILALISSRGFKWAFRLGYGINAAFSIFVMVIVVWLEFFWHW
jgi:hypothetical protein